MNKINFENGTLITPAKVNVEGTVYEVQPEVYSGNTPLTADILNLMQDNIEDAIDEVIDTINGTTLYDNSTGTTGDITLSSSISAKKRIRISGYHLHADTKYYFCQEFDVILNGKTSLFAKSYDGLSNSYACTEELTLNSTSITRGAQYLIGLNNNTRIDTTIHITKVVGYDS